MPGKGSPGVGVNRKVEEWQVLNAVRALSDYAGGGGHASVEKIAGDLECSPATVLRRLKELQAAGKVTRGYDGRRSWWWIEEEVASK